jgi:tetratricopeptide (TPR) repeat protein
MGSGISVKFFLLLFVTVCLLVGDLKGHAELSSDERAKAAIKPPSFYLDRAKLQLERKQYAPAVRSLSLAIRSTPGLAEAYKLRGGAYEHIGASHKAMQDFTKYIELKPSDVHGYILRGDARNFSGDHDRALEDYNRAINLSSRSIPAHLGRGLAYAAMERYTSAMKDYQWVLALDPDNNEAAENMALACMSAGKPLLAVTYFERALENERDPAWRAKIQKWLDQVVNDPSLESRKTGRSTRPRPAGPTAKPMW